MKRHSVKRQCSLVGPESPAIDAALQTTLLFGRQSSHENMIYFRDKLPYFPMQNGEIVMLEV